MALHNVREAWTVDAGIVLVSRDDLLVAGKEEAADLTRVRASDEIHFPASNTPPFVRQPFVR